MARDGPLKNCTRFPFPICPRTIRRGEGSARNPIPGPSFRLNPASRNAYEFSVVAAPAPAKGPRLLPPPGTVDLRETSRDESTPATLLVFAGSFTPPLKIQRAPVVPSRERYAVPVPLR